MANTERQMDEVPTKSISRASSESLVSIQYKFVKPMQMLTKAGKSAHKSPFYLSACRREGGNEFGESRRTGGCAGG